MWPRGVEILLGGWLLASPFLLGHPGDKWAWWVNDLFCGALLISLALACFAPRLRRAHLVSIVVGGWLVVFGYFAGPTPNPPALQNDIVVGLAALMMAIIPSEASRPPVSWRQFLRSD